MKIVFLNGCFDGLHAGHIHLLMEARKLGDKLIVGLNSDASVQRLKGVEKPIFPVSTREKMLRELRCVSDVEVFWENTPERLIRDLKPDLIVKGDDWRDVPRPWDDVCPTVFIPRLPGFSSSR